MGAEFSIFTVKGGNKLHVERRFKARQDKDAYEMGHSYSGGFNMANGILVREHLKFKSYEEAEQYLCDNCKKWEEAIAVMYRNNAGQLVWLVGARLAC